MTTRTARPGEPHDRGDDEGHTVTASSHTDGRTHAAGTSGYPPGLNEAENGVQPLPVGSSAAREVSVPPADGDGLDLGAARLPIHEPGGEWPEEGDRPGGCRFCAGAGIDETGETCGDCCGVKVDSMLWFWEIAWLRSEVRRLSAAPSFAHPVPLTAELLAAHGGTLPDGTVLRNDTRFRLVHEDMTWSADWVFPLMFDTLIANGDWLVVHLPVHFGAES